MHALTLVRNQPDGVGLHRLTFDRPVPGHTEPGQFITVHVGDHKPAYFAIASVPGAPTELLVKHHGDTADTLVAMAPGDTVQVSDPLGKGFGLPAADSKPLLILATGSGLSAVRSVVEAEVAAGLPRPLVLFYGVYTPEHASYAERLDAWKAAGVDVRLVVSEPGDGWSGPTGFVQVAADEAGWIRDDVRAVLCGWPAMVEQATAMLLDAGVDADDVHTNF